MMMILATNRISVVGIMTHYGCGGGLLQSAQVVTLCSRSTGFSVYNLQNVWGVTNEMNTLATRGKV
jgi:hypothetical protein